MRNLTHQCRGAGDFCCVHDIEFGFACGACETEGFEPEEDAPEEARPQDTLTCG